MNDETTTLDQADEEILTYTVSDEEGAAGTEMGVLLRDTVYTAVCLIRC